DVMDRGVVHVAGPAGVTERSVAGVVVGDSNTERSGQGGRVPRWRGVGDPGGESFDVDEVVVPAGGEPEAVGETFEALCVERDDRADEVTPGGERDELVDELGGLDERPGGAGDPGMPLVVPA